MKIFHCVESYNPSVGGMQEVVKQLSERLVTFGHDVTVLTRYNKERSFKELNGVKVIQFNIGGNPSEVTNKEEQQYVDFLLTNSSDIITFFAAQQWATDLALPVLKKLKARKVSVPTGYSGLYKPEFRDYFDRMKSRIHDYDMNIYLSYNYRDINFARENNVKNITVIPNGAAADEFMRSSGINVRSHLNIKHDNFLILHVGSYTGKKGHSEAIELFLRSKLKQATLLMIGNGAENFWKRYFRFPLFGMSVLFNRLFYKKRIIFKYFSRQFTVAAYKQSDLFLFPSNIECSPIVLFECAAAKLPYLSTDVGNSVEITEWLGGGEILPTQKDSEGTSHVIIAGGLKKLEELYLNGEKRKKLAENTHRKWSEKYSWEKIAKQYETLYLELLNKQ